jgi:predicted DNA-binding ribbon-helix-helix protein
VRDIEISIAGAGQFRRREITEANGSLFVKSTVIKRSVVVAGHKTSVSLEDAFWKGLKEIAGVRDMTLSDLVAAIDSERQHGNLSSAIRLSVLDFYMSQLSNIKEQRLGTREAVTTLSHAV